jgi:predicted fused transcriptional regulator/phosphomethylpyrimidine kinase
MKDGRRREGPPRSEAEVQVELYEEIWKGTLPGFFRVIAQFSREPEASKDKWWRVRRRIREARRYRDIMHQLGWGGLIFMSSWFKRTWLSRTTIEEWTMIMDVLEDGRTWFHEEIVRVFGNTAPRFLESLTGTDLDEGED